MARRPQEQIGSQDLKRRVDPRLQGVFNHSEEPSCLWSAWPLEYSLTGAPGTALPYVDQLTRDDRLATPKHPPRLFHRCHKLFGARALLPLKSRVRAESRARVNPTVTELLLARCGDERMKRSRSKDEKNRQTEARRGEESDRDDVRWRKAGKDFRLIFVVETIRDAVNAR